MPSRKHIVILITIVSYSNGQLSDVIGFLPDLNAIQLNDINYSTITIGGIDVINDELMHDMVDKIEKQIMPLGYEDQIKCLNQETCEVPILLLLPIGSSWLQQNQSCEVKGRFIQNTCQTILIYANYAIEFDSTFYHWIKCNLVHQPVVFVLRKSNSTSFELFEVQIETRMVLNLVTWNNDDPPRYFNVVLISMICSAHVLVAINSER